MDNTVAYLETLILTKLNFLRITIFNSFIILTLVSTILQFLTHVVLVHYKIKKA